MSKIKKTCFTSSNIDKNTLYSITFQNKLALEAKNGNQSAKTLLIESLKNLIYSIAQQKSPNKDLIPDLAQEASLYLLSSGLKSYDSSLNVPFRSYAVYWIVHGMDLYLNSNLVGVPFRVPYDIGCGYRSRKIKENREKETSRIINYQFLKENGKYKDKDEEEISIFETIGSEDEYTEEENKKELLDRIVDALNMCPIKDKIKRMLLRYYRLGNYANYPEISFTELSKEFGLTSQYVSRLIKGAIETMKENVFS